MEYLDKKELEDTAVAIKVADEECSVTPLMVGRALEIIALALGAKADPDTVKQLAEAAGLSAELAARAAATAQNTANKAQTAANNAQTAADNAQTSADNAQTTADDAQTRISHVQNNFLEGDRILRESLESKINKVAKDCSDDGDALALQIAAANKTLASVKSTAEKAETDAGNAQTAADNAMSQALVGKSMATSAYQGLNALQERFNTLVGSEEAEGAIDTFNEIVAFLEEIEDDSLQQILENIRALIADAKDKAESAYNLADNTYKISAEGVINLGVVESSTAAFNAAAAKSITENVKVRQIRWRTSDNNSDGGQGDGGTIFQERRGNWFVTQWMMFEGVNRICKVRYITTGGNYSVSDWYEITVGTEFVYDMINRMLKLRYPQPTTGGAGTVRDIFQIPEASTSYAGFMSAEDKIKLNNIGTGAKLGAGVNITSTNISTWNNKVSQVAGKGLSTNDFTDEDKEKLDNIGASVTFGDLNIFGEGNEFGNSISVGNNVSISSDVDINIASGAEYVFGNGARLGANSGVVGTKISYDVGSRVSELRFRSIDNTGRLDIVFPSGEWAKITFDPHAVTSQRAGLVVGGGGKSVFLPVGFDGQAVDEQIGDLTAKVLDIMDHLGMSN